MKKLTLLVLPVFIIGCAPLTNTEVDTQIQSKYYEAIIANASKENAPTFKVTLGEAGCPHCEIEYNDPNKRGNVIERSKTSAEVAGSVAEKLMSPLTTLIQFGGVYGIVKAATGAAGTGNTTTTNTIAGSSNTATSTPTASNSTVGYSGDYQNSDSHATQDSHDATSTPTVVDTKVVEVQPVVVNPVVVKPEVVQPVQPVIIQ